MEDEINYPDEDDNHISIHDNGSNKFNNYKYINDEINKTENMYRSGNKNENKDKHKFKEDDEAEYKYYHQIQNKTKSNNEDFYEDNIYIQLHRLL